MSSDTDNGIADVRPDRTDDRRRWSRSQSNSRRSTSSGTNRQKRPVVEGDLSSDSEEDRDDEENSCFEGTDKDKSLRSRRRKNESWDSSRGRNSSMKRNASDSYIMKKAQTKEESEKHRRVSDIQKPTSDSAVSTLSASAVSASVISTSADSRVFSSPSMSDQSKRSISPRRSKSPELSRALRLKQERFRRERDLYETRSRLKKHQLDQQQEETDKAKSTKPSLERTKSMELSKYRISGKVLTGKSSSSSLGAIRDMEEKYVRRRHRSRSEKANIKVAYEHKATSPRTSPDRVLQTSSDNTNHRDKEASSESPERTRKRSRSSKNESSSKENNNSTVKVKTPSNRSNCNDNSAVVTSSTSKFPSHPEEKTKLLYSYGKSKDSKANMKEDSSISSDANISGLQHLSPEGTLDDDRPTNIQESSTYTVRVISKQYGDSDDSNHSAVQGVSCLETVQEVPASTEEIEKKTSMAIDAILRDGLPGIPPLENSTESVLLDWRGVFRAEMVRLRKEVNDFRQFCQKQIEVQALAVEKSWNQPKNGLKSHEPPRLAEQLKDLEVNMQLFHRKQNILDLETELLSREEKLSERQKSLEEYEKEILEVESMLNHRQAICDRRQKALVNLDEELQSLRQELEETREHIQSDGSIPESNSERARKNWDMVRRNLMDKQHLLETTVQKYRSELAAASSTIAGKDILISRLQASAMEHDDELANRDRRIKQLESKLTLALTETKNLSEQMNSYSYRDILRTNNHAHGDNGSEFSAPFAPRRSSQELIPDHSRVSFRSVMYRRPSNNAGSDQGDDYGKSTLHPPGDHGSGDTEQLRNGSRIVRKRNNSISDNAISRLTLSTPRNDDKFGRGSSACVVQ